MEIRYVVRANDPEFGLARLLYVLVDGKRQTLPPELVRVHRLEPGDEIVIRKRGSDT